jgi:hypothetical protein
VNRRSGGLLQISHPLNRDPNKGAFCKYSIWYFTKGPQFGSRLLIAIQTRGILQIPRGARPEKPPPPPPPTSARPVPPGSLWPLLRSNRLRVSVPPATRALRSWSKLLRVMVPAARQELGAVSRWWLLEINASRVCARELCCVGPCRVCPRVQVCR